MKKVVGELYTTETAINKFGTVIKSVSIRTDMLKHALEESDGYLLFRIENKRVRFLNSKREVILGDAPRRDEVFNVLSKEKIVELIEKGGSGTTYFNKTTSGHDTIVNGKMALQKSEPCPPFC